MIPWQPIGDEIKDGKRRLFCNETVVACGKWTQAIDRSGVRLDDGSWHNDMTHFAELDRP